MTAGIETPTERSQRRVPGGLLLALALLSGAGLLLEVALTRLLSTLYYPPTVFAVISLAVLGLGLGAALAAARPAWRAAPGEAAALAGLSALLVALVAVWSVPWDLLPLLLLLVIVPYLFTGLALASIFARRSAESPRLYLADLVGAGMGALLAMPLLDVLGGVNGVLAAGVGLGVVGLVEWGHGEGNREGRPRTAAAVILLGLALLAGNVWGGVLGIDMARLAAEKPIVESLQGDGEIVATRWDAFARSDLVAPGDGGPYELYIDGAAGSVMPPAENNEFLWQDIGLFPFATEQPERVFVIGPGGGLDVWFGLQSGAEEIVAVEVNGASIELVQEFAAYNGDLYGQPGVRVLRDEGRSVLRREGGTYDLIFMSQLVTQAAERSGYALVEDHAFTVEAFGEYLAHLAPQGMLALKLYDEPTLTRALATALAALRERGVQSDAQALMHVMAFVDTRAGGGEPIPLLIVRERPFSREDSLSLGAVARQVGFQPLFLPHALAQPPLEAVAAGEMAFEQIISQSDADIRPARDNRPFFYQFERGLPASLRPLLAGLAALALVGGVLLAVLQRRAAEPAVGFARLAPLYFAALGVGFIMLEVAILQQTRLFLGHPTLAIAVVLATLLVGGGVGSGLAGRLAARAARPPLWAPLLAGALGLGWLLAWPVLAEAFRGAEQGARLLLVAATLLPPALAMGMPFPLGLRALGSERDVALGWAVNGVMTVVGSALAVAAAMVWGFAAVGAVAVGAYVVAGGVVGIELQNRFTGAR